MQDNFTVLERDLERLGRAVAYPPTPPLAAAVRARLAASPAARPAPRWGLAGAALAAAVVALAVIAGTITPARNAMADLLDRINIFEVEELPADLTTDVEGEPVTLEEAEDRLGRPVRLPTHPVGVESSLATLLYQDYPDAELEAVVLLFDPPSGEPFALFQTTALAGKGLGPGAAAAPVPGIGDGQAYWIEGPRVFQLYDHDGNVIRESARLADANTLIWSREGWTLRLEGNLTLEEATLIAKSLE